MPVDKLWEVFSNIWPQFLLLCVGIAVITEAIKRVATKDKVKRFLPVIPLVIGLVGMMLIAIALIPSERKEWGSWIVVYGSMGLFAGSISSHVYAMVKKSFFNKISPPKSEPEKDSENG